MTLRDTFMADLKTAMLAKETIKVATLRLILSTLKDKDIAARTAENTHTGLGDEHILSMLQGMIKQRKDSIEQYQKGNRQDLVDREQAEINVIENYLPQAMNDTEMDQAIGATITTINAAGVKDMGKVMAELKAKYAGQMDFTKASALVKQKLAG